MRIITNDDVQPAHFWASGFLDPPKFSMSLVNLGGVFGGEFHMRSLLDLLPKGGNSMVDSFSNEVRFFQRILFLIQEAEESIGYFLKGDLFNFDPHVGDTACQIRAYYFALLWTKRDEIFPSLECDLTKLRTYAEKTSILLDQGRRNANRDLRPCSLSVFFEKLGLKLSISEIGLTLTNAHFLSKYRLIDEEGISQSMDALKLQRCMNESRIFVREFLNILQVNLSFLSVNWVMHWAEELPKNHEFVTTPAVLKKLIREGDDGRFSLPSFGVLDVILKHIRHISRLPIFFALTVLTESSRYLHWKWIQVVDNQYNFLDCLSSTLEGSSCLVIRAVSSNIQEVSNENYFKFVLEKIKKNGIEKTFLWVNADHPQYSGRKLRDFRENPVPEEPLERDLDRYKLCYEKAKQEGRKGGCNLRNPRFFYLDHFDVSQISSLLKPVLFPSRSLYRFLKKELILSKIS